MAAGVFAKNEHRARHTNGMRRHDFVRERIFEHAVLMDAGFMSERVASDDGFVWLYAYSSDFTQQLAGSVEMLGVYPGVIRIVIAAHVHGHHDLFERSISCAFADSVDAAFHLAGPSRDSRQGIGHRQPKIVVTVGRDRDLLDAAKVVANRGDQGGELRWSCIAHRVRNIEGRSACVHNGLQDSTEKLRVGAAGIFRRKLDVGAEGFRQANGGACLLYALVARNAELVLQMNVGSREKDVDAGTRGSLQGLPCAFNVRGAGSGQAGDDRPANVGRDRLNRFEVSLRGDGEAGFDDIHAEAVKLPRHAQFLLHVHAAAWGLLAIAEGCVEYHHALPSHTEKPPWADKLPCYVDDLLKHSL